ncbi:MAG: type II toxin-antitoxin system RelE/ParE family toxin [Bdellovibrionales bacterium]|nr:type II toxin-antitoxin system RelE/ParE family toxin [Bdellovibrionales bacterium]
MKFDVLRSEEFSQWYARQPRSVKAIVDARLDRIAEFGHFGFVNRFDGLIELKWTSGMRIYTFVFQGAVVVALNGGNKNGQQADIKDAQKIKNRWVRTFLSK